MKNLYSNNSGFVLKIFLLLTILFTVIYGCRKDLTQQDTASFTTPDISKAKTWFENTYHINNSGQPVHTNSIGTTLDLSQKIKPDWQHTATYTRLGKDVIEMPVDPDSKFGTILKKKVNNNAYSKTYTRSSFLLLKGPKGYQAYIMTIVADSSYIKGDPAKLANNTYRQHDADFSGLVLYFTPNGKYVNGYAYQNGQLVTSASQVQSSGKTQVQLARICTDWYADVYVDNVLVASVYLYTTCTSEQDPGNSGSPAPPDPCISQTPPPTIPPPATPNPPSTPPTGPIIPQATVGGHLTVNNVPGGGGGFPPPLDDDDPCVINPQDIINKIKDPCLRAMVDATINTSINTQVNSMIQNVFGDNNGNLNLTFSDEFPMQIATDDAEDVPLFVNDDPLQGLISTSIHLNASTLSSSSQEYIAATVMHEALHSYLDSKGIDVGDDQHTVMAANYVNTMANDLMQMFPGLIKDAAYSLAWAGLEGTYAYSHPGNVYFPQYQSYINTLYRAHTDGNGHTFGHGCNN